MERDAIVRLSPPWYTYHRKVLAMFGTDPEVHIKDLADMGNGQYTYMILVESRKKADAIKLILPQTVPMGNITITVTILGPGENEAAAPDLPISPEIYEAAFEGNPVFEKIAKVSYGLVSFNYCVFKKEIIQFWNDDMSDYRGNYNGLPSDVAREILISNDMQFCISAE